MRKSEAIFIYEDQDAYGDYADERFACFIVKRDELQAIVTRAEELKSEYYDKIDENSPNYDDEVFGYSDSYLYVMNQLRQEFWLDDIECDCVQY